MALKISDAFAASDQQRKLMQSLFQDHASLYDIFRTCLPGSATFDPPNILNNATATTTVTVTGAALGDYVFASFSLDLAGLVLTAYVNIADTVTAVFTNNSGGAVNLASGTLRVYVIKSAQFAAALAAQQVAAS